MSEGMLHIRDVEGPKKTGSVETRLEAMEQQVFKCQGMVERGLNGNHMMITEFTSNDKMDTIDIGKHLSRLYDKVDQLQGQIYDLQNQNLSALWEWGYLDLPACGPGLAHFIDQNPTGPTPLKASPSRGAKTREEEQHQDPQGASSGFLRSGGDPEARPGLRSQG
ncbi:40S ribosomal protein S5-1 [Hordeum vulgare]|nr:40S ribosomal protein S5-1 [Hordeum vulgare]